MQHERCPEGDAFVLVKGQRQIPQQDQAERCADNRAQAHKKNTVPQRGRQGSQEGYHGGMIEVPPGQFAGIEQVVGFILSQAEFID